MKQPIENYQEQGTATSAADANAKIAAARNATPASIRHLFRSAIQRDSLGYLWYWILI